MAEKIDQSAIELNEEIVDKLDPKYFFFDLPLYESVDIPDTETQKRVASLISFSDQFDAYNYKLKENSTFEGSNGNFYHWELKAIPVIKRIMIRCKRTDQYYFYYVRVSDHEVMKIGQYPSLADLHIAHIKKYSKVLDKEKLKEFTKGIGLRAHGVGIGSFVYLRRIFEHLIENEHKKKSKTDGWDEAVYQKARMSEKIELLKDSLPPFLVENKSIYSILSLGIHELSENDCLTYFDALKIGIQEILDEKVIEARREKAKKDAGASIQRIKQRIEEKKK